MSFTSGLDILVTRDLVSWYHRSWHKSLVGFCSGSPALIGDGRSDNGRAGTYSHPDRRYDALASVLHGRAFPEVCLRGNLPAAAEVKSAVDRM